MGILDAYKPLVKEILTGRATGTAVNIRHANGMSQVDGRKAKLPSFSPAFKSRPGGRHGPQADIIGVTFRGAKVGSIIGHRKHGFAFFLPNGSATDLAGVSLKETKQRVRARFVG